MKLPKSRQNAEWNNNRNKGYAVAHHFKYSGVMNNSIKLVTWAVCPVKVVQDFGHVGSETPGKIGPKINKKIKKKLRSEKKTER